MADDSSLLSKEQKKAIVDWLTQKRGPKPLICPICSTEKWSVADHVVTPTVIGAQTGDFQLGGTLYPQGMVVCNNCGYTHYLNIARLNIPPRKEDGK